MRWTSLLLGLLAAGATARWVSRSAQARRMHEWPAATPMEPQEHQAEPGLNPAERMQARNDTGSPMGEGTPLAEAAQGEDLFDSSSRHGSSTPVMTGLPDFSRGA